MERTFVLIFFFWAVLAIVTPTLIVLSENSKLLDAKGDQKSVGMKARKMVVSAEKYPIKVPIAPPKREAPAPAPAPEPARAPAPIPVPAMVLKPALKQALRAKIAISRRFFRRSTDTSI